MAADARIAPCRRFGYRARAVSRRRDESRRALLAACQELHARLFRVARGAAQTCRDDGAPFSRLSAAAVLGCIRSESMMRYSFTAVQIGAGLTNIYFFVVFLKNYTLPIDLNDIT